MAIYALVVKIVKNSAKDLYILYHVIDTIGKLNVDIQKINPRTGQQTHNKEITEGWEEKYSKTYVSYAQEFP